MIKSTIRILLARYLSSITSALHKRSRRPPSRWPDTIVVSGFFKGGFGIARGAELTARALERNGFTVVRHDVEPLLSSRLLFSHRIGAPRSAAWFIHLNAPEMSALLARLNPCFIPQGLRIAYWAWELPVFPKGWTCGDRIADVIAFPSEFSSRAFTGMMTQKMTLPHPLMRAEAENWFRSDRPRDGQERFTFLVQMDGLSSINRKNVLFVIDVFQSTFLQAEKVRLVVKTQNLNSQQQNAVLDAIAGSSSIDWIDRKLDQAEMVALMASVDCLVSAHRSEGFGLALAEAALCGKRVVATGWSGNVDFMRGTEAALIDYRIVDVNKSDDVYGKFKGPGACWAEPDRRSLEKLMLFHASLGPSNDHVVIQENLASNERVWDAIVPGGLVVFP